MMQKIIHAFVYIVVALSIAVSFTNCNRSSNTANSNIPTDISDRYRTIVDTEFINKARQHNADTRYLILVDYSIPSNDYRLFIWDTEQDKIVEKSWCAHGFGGESTAENPVFSNTPGSNCSSLGWYLVDRGVGVSAHYGYKYHAVDGLDASNSNARRRQILIHPWSSVTHDYEARISQPMNLDGRCAGCFTTTDKGYKTIDRYAKSSQKRILLYAINGI